MEASQATKPEKNERGEWNNPVEFILSCLGYAVGLGNVWRFPYLTYINGGGAFLIPYTIMLTFVGIPLFFMELAAGQYVGGGPITVWTAIAPILQGVGVGMMVISFIGSIYYNMIIGWSLYYMFASWQKVLPWSNCEHDYNTEFCYSRLQEEQVCPGNESVLFNNTCHNSSDLGNLTERRISASEEYFNNAVLNRSPTMDENGEIQWKLVLVLLLAWILCYLCVIKGIRSSGKVVYFTATFPYLIIVILIIRGALLEGALEGIKFYIVPKWEMLKTAKVWVDAAGQIFFSLSVGMGGLMTFASYNKFHNNVYRDTLIVTIGNCLTSFIAGFAIFSVLGFLAHVMGQEVSEVVQSGSGLAFVAYPEVVLWIEPPQLWSTLFFFMLITLGLDSQFAGIENLMTALVDLLPNLRRYKPLVAFVLCAIMFLLGLTMCTQAGVYWLELMSYYSSGWSLVLIGMCEAMIFAWWYKASRLKKDIETMIGFRLYPHWWFCWTFISPLLLLGILIFNFIDFTPLSYGDYLLPDWAQGLGWLMALASVLTIPVFAVLQFVMSYKTSENEDKKAIKILKRLSQPSKRWRENYEKNKTALSETQDVIKNNDNVFTVDKAVNETYVNVSYDTYESIRL